MEDCILCDYVYMKSPEVVELQRLPGTESGGRVERRSGMASGGVISPVIKCSKIF